MTDALRTHGWGYFPIDPKYKGEDFRKGVTPMFYKDHFNFDRSYVLIGVEPSRMFEPGTEPKQLDFFHWDNSMQPWLRHITPANGSGHKLWSRLTYRGWSMPWDSPALELHRQRINKRLREDSQGKIRDIAELWGGNRPTRLPVRKHALICPSSHRNHQHFFKQSQEQWLQMVTQGLREQGYTYSIRQKVGVNARKTNQTTDQLKREDCDLLVANYSACASEAVVLGYPVVTTTNQNPARAVSTKWSEFCSGIIREYTPEQIDHWTTRICAYTWHRHDLDRLAWIDTHPQAEHLKKARYES